MNAARLLQGKIKKEGEGELCNSFGKKKTPGWENKTGRRSAWM